MFPLPSSLQAFSVNTPTQEGADAHSEHFLLPDDLGEEEGLERKTLLGGLERLAALDLRAVRAKPGAEGARHQFGQVSQQVRVSVRRPAKERI